MSCCNCQANTISDEKFLEIQETLKKYPKGQRELLIPILQDVQEILSYISRQAMTIIAQHVQIPTSKVYGVVTFYNQFKLIAPGRNEILVCRGTACHVRGSDKILKAFEAELGIKAGQTTSDGEYGLDVVACLGSCSIAPVITANGIFHGRLTTKDIPNILKQIKEENNG